MSVMGLLKEVLVEFIKCVGDGFREEVALHGIGRDGAIDRFDESDSSSHGEALSFPVRKTHLNFINNELESCVRRPGVV